MSIVAIALIGPSNDPIYFKDYISSSLSSNVNNNNTSSSKGVNLDPINNNDNNDITDITYHFNDIDILNSNSTKFQFIIHSALDSIESNDRWKSPPSPSAPDSSPLSRSSIPLGFLGFLLPIDSYRIYAYHGLGGILVVGVVSETMVGQGGVCPSMGSQVRVGRGAGVKRQ